MGWSPWRASGSSFEVVTSPANRLDKTLASRFFQCLHDQTLSLQNTFAEPITSRGREQPGPAGDLRCPDGSAARFAIMRPTQLAACELRPRTPDLNLDYALMSNTIS